MNIQDWFPLGWTGLYKQIYLLLLIQYTPNIISACDQYKNY